MNNPSSLLGFSGRLVVGAFRPAFVLVALAAGLTAVGCSSDSGDKDGASGGTGSGGTGSGGGGTGGGDGKAVYAPCAEGKRFGVMNLALVPPASAGTGHAEFNGGVADGVDPRNIWEEKKKEGDCRLIVGPKLLCAPTCESGKICTGKDNVCVPEPSQQDAGKITITGLKEAFTAQYTAGGYYTPLTGAFPPVDAGAEVTLSAAGNKAPAFTITSSGIDPLEVADADITLDTTKPLTISWKPPTKAGTSHVIVSLDLAHHGNVAAKLVCDVADTGSTTIPVSMLTALAAEGVAGFPSVAIVRRAVNSASIGEGCVEFAISSAVDRQLLLPGVTSCNCPNSTCEPCQAGQTCKPNYTCG